MEKEVPPPVRVKMVSIWDGGADPEELNHVAASDLGRLSPRRSNEDMRRAEAGRAGSLSSVLKSPAISA